MDLIFDTALDQWHDWETTQAQWLLLDDTYTPDQVAQVWVSDVTGHELSVANYQRQPVTGRTRSVDVAQHRVAYGCDDPDFGYIAAGSQGLSMMCLAKVGVDDSSSLLLAAFDLPNIGSGLELQPLVSPSGVYWIAPVEPDTYTLTFRAPPAGVPAGAQSAFLSVPGATEVTTITWENLPPGVVNIYSEAFGTAPWTTLTSPPPSGSMDLPTGTLTTDGPTRISMIPTMPLAPGAKVELTVLGAGAVQETPPNDLWMPEGGFDYWLESNFELWSHVASDPGHYRQPGYDNRRASVLLSEQFVEPRDIIEIQLIAEASSNYTGVIYIHTPPPRYGLPPTFELTAEFDVAGGLVWSDEPGWGSNIFYLYVDIYERWDTWNQDILPPEDARLKVRIHVAHALTMPPGDSEGMPGHEIQFEGYPLDVVGWPQPPTNP